MPLESCAFVHDRWGSEIACFYVVLSAALARLYGSIDDLTDLEHLEDLVQTSQCMLVFLSKSYFRSANCMRELTAALGKQLPIVLVQELDASKGGDELATLRLECAAWHNSLKLQTEQCSLLEEGREIILWHRLFEFQQLSLKRIASAMLHATPVYREMNAPPSLYFPRECSVQLCVFDRPTHVYINRYNYGPSAAIKKLVERCGCTNLTHSFRNQFSERRSSAWKQSLRLTRTATYDLLYLSTKTFQGSVGQYLAEEVRVAMMHGVNYILIHENDEAYGGCSFSRYGLYMSCLPLCKLVFQVLIEEICRNEWSTLLLSVMHLHFAQYSRGSSARFGATWSLSQNCDTISCTSIS